MRIVCIPGLGFTSAVFRKLNWENHRPVFLEWLDPLGEENIQHYAQRMLDRLPAEREDLALVGHSFGGIMAQEISQLTTVKQIILISSVQSRQEIPRRYRATDPLGISYLFFAKPALWTLPLWGPHFGYSTQEEQVLFREMVGSQSTHLLQWSLRRFSQWQGVPQKKCPIYHIHGDRDKTLHFDLIKKVDARIEGGTHLMVFNRSEEISPLLLKQL